MRVRRSDELVPRWQSDGSVFKWNTASRENNDTLLASLREESQAISPLPSVQWVLWVENTPIFNDTQAQTSWKDILCC